MQVSTVNTNGVIVIKIEYLSCSPTFTVRSRKASIILQIEKLQDLALKDYINTSCTGNLEYEIPVEKLDGDIVFDYQSMKQHFENGLITITLSALNDEF
ncbi:unnamed protein product [Rotaria sp. Silwood1]|nr:unnamed protein product [Rotaria sp. Silwood1]CAF1459560.1 unnamed protein product [Rotaria sp. Silwood1]CAF3590412.1 unnamed protein product [Rotaria sp. Silwood1]CAF3636506.1 unnamed protein product [Rotaria sp. Silwood1]CAF3684881.1 unnamed protein product [Rotaria sp. Silwood1]